MQNVVAVSAVEMGEQKVPKQWFWSLWVVPAKFVKEHSPKFQ